jgi:nucleoside-diphosphate-sugar epimerase
VQILEELLHRKAQIVETPCPPSEPLITYADTSKAKELLGYEPKVSIEEGLSRFVNWLRAERLL